jgi:bacterioferritin-associated ferredoxin
VTGQTGWTRQSTPDLGAVKACTRAGTSCGSCLPLVKKLMTTELTKQCITVSSALCEHFALSRAQLFDAIRAAVPVPMRVVRLEVDAALVERRLSGDPSEARSHDDLHVALEWLAAGHGVGLEDLLLSGDRPVRETSTAICSWLGWL